MQFKRVLIESPFAGKGNSPEEVAADRARNVRYAQAAMKDCLSRGEAPMVSHLLYTQVLDDNVPFERDMGIGAGLAWGEVAEMTIVYDDLGISNGMNLGIQNALTKGRLVQYRQVPGWQK